MKHLQQVKRTFLTLGHLSLSSNVWEPPYPYTHPWEAKRSLMVVSRLLGLDQMWSWERDELVAMTEDTLLFSCLFPTLGTWINWQPMCQGKLTVSHLTPPQCGSCTCRLHAPLSVKNCIWRPLMSSTEASARLWHWKGNVKLYWYISADPTEGFWNLGEGFFLCWRLAFVFFSWDWNLNPVKWNEKKRPFSPLSPTSQIKKFWKTIILCYQQSKKVKNGLWYLSL